MAFRSWLFVVALCGTGWVFAAPPAVTQARLACIPRDANTKITAHVEGKPTAVRAYFHQTGDSCGEYYVDMRPSPQDPTLYTAILPLVAADATSIMYQVHVLNAGGKETLADFMVAPVSGNCVAPPLTPDDLHAANAIALGLTLPGQHSVPCHFKCNGIVSVITASGELKPNEECRLVLAGKTLPWWEKRGVLGAAGAIGAGAIAAGLGSGSNNNRTPPSPARP
jgi:hypothetical protein